MAAKKGASAEATALEALRKLVTDPRPRVLFGKTGIFPKKTQKDAADLCETHSWIEKTPETLKKGKSSEHLYRITLNGIHAVLSKTESLELLKILQMSIGDIEATLKALPEKISSLKTAVASLVASSQAPDFATLAKQVLSGSNSGNEAHLETTVQEILVGRNSPSGDCSLPDLYKTLRDRYPSLSIGAFHDALRNLKKEGKLVLTNWALPLMEMPDSDLALVISHKVIYYVNLA